MTDFKNVGRDSARLIAVQDFLGSDDSNNTQATTSVAANRDGSLAERTEYLIDRFDTVDSSFLALPRCVAKTDGAVSATADPLFTITGGPIRCRMFGLVTTDLEASTSTGKLTLTTTVPAATVDMSAGAVELNGDIAGTSYRHINTTAVLTPVTAGFVMMGSAFATEDTQFFCPIGTINFICANALTGVIAWYCEYTPLSPLSRVAAAA